METFFFSSEEMFLNVENEKNWLEESSSSELFVAPHLSTKLFAQWCTQLWSRWLPDLTRTYSGSMTVAKAFGKFLSRSSAKGLPLSSAIIWGATSRLPSVQRCLQKKKPKALRALKLRYKCAFQPLK